MKTTRVRLELPPKLIPVFTGEAIFRGAYGGRGSGKTRSFCKMAAAKGISFAEANMPGYIVCGREYQNTLAESSLAEVKLAIMDEPYLLDRYDLGENYIRTKDGKVEFAFIGLRHNLDSIKSKARIRLLYVDEAEPVSDVAWSKAIPTVREDGSEIWVTWNPERKGSATDKRFRLDPPGESKIIELNWRDNPKFPKLLNKLRLQDLEKRPEEYDHIWEGGYKLVTAGSYFSKEISKAKAEGRVGFVPYDPLMTYRAFWDIGGTGAKADACSIWIAQIVGKEVRVLNYYEAVGQPLSVHINWLINNGYDKAMCYLPHDGVTHDRVFNVTYESELKRAGFRVEQLKNQGAGAAMQRIESVRKIFPYCWFDKELTEPGLAALGHYHKKIDPARGIDLGPEHDWSSHGADSFGLLAIIANEVLGIQALKSREPGIERVQYYGSNGWMG